MKKRVFIIKTHYKFGECFAETRKCGNEFGILNHLQQRISKITLKKFDKTGSVQDQKHKHTCEISVPKKISEVSASIVKNPKIFIRHRSQ